MDEVFPIAMGVIFGALYASDIKCFKSWWLRLLLTLAAGIAATVASGEYHENWGFSLVDIGEVGVFSWISYFFTRRLRQHLAMKAARRGDVSPLK